MTELEALATLCEKHGWVAESTALKWLITDHARLKSGQLTAEEFHNVCHQTSKALTPEEFDAGCQLYQQLLFGRCPSQEKIKELFMRIAHLQARLKKQYEPNCHKCGKQLHRPICCAECAGQADM